jgi:type III restriction enzyme
MKSLMYLYEALAMKVTDWLKNQYPIKQFTAIAEILEWARNPDTSTFKLREPQLRALETYWYLRLVENNQHIFDLYTRFYKKTTERLAALGMDTRISMIWPWILA